MKLIVSYVSFIILFSQYNIYGQVNYSIPLKYSGGSAKIISKDKLNNEEDYLREEIKTNSDPELLFKLAEICTEKHTIEGRSEARSLLTTAIYRNPENLEYRFLLAGVLSSISDGLSADIYKEIIKIDSTSSKALFKLGLIEEAEFDDYHNSVFKDGDEPSLSLERFARGDFLKAEEYLSKSIKYDSLNREAYLHLSYLYEDNNEPKNGIICLNRLAGIYPHDMDAHLYLGLLYYETSQIEKSLKEFKQALLLMPDSVKEDFTFNSVKELIKPVFGEKFEKLPVNELKEIINIFWKITNPLYISDYNERLLEHYSRVAYSNLRFTLYDKRPGSSGILEPGWKTDRGEMILRYGIPLNKTRFRPFINAGGSTVINMKTDVWYYKNFTLGFTDQYWNNNFIYSELMPGSKYVPQYAGDTQTFVNYLRKVQYQIYSPKFEGPNIKVPFNIVQFRDEKYNYTDVYLNYAYIASDSLAGSNKYFYNHDWGLFFFDTVFNTIAAKRGMEKEYINERLINLHDGNKTIVNTLAVSIYPEPGTMAFEIKRIYDKGISTNHFEFDPKKFKLDEPDMSDIILASAMSNDTLNHLPLERKKISFLPNPLNKFSLSEPIFVYYEPYNFSKDKNGYTNIEQKLIIKKKILSSGLASTFNSILNVVGLGKQKEEVTITTKYQTHEQDPQISFRLDMHNYAAGEYILTLIVKDDITGKEISKDVTLAIY